ncbi:hypothetical protein [Brevibacillus choshinensis]|uniref:hypothetical protein n=1 Tax=Brevibacillus choshinensis TaxID=54911 RepID=UPI002E1B845C|nr:hypothetical protein [Brevibacillus choshinensis]
MDVKKRESQHEPTVAPSMNGHDPLEEEASAEEIETGDYTSVTKLFLDRTPED